MASDTRAPNGLLLVGSFIDHGLLLPAEKNKQIYSTGDGVSMGMTKDKTSLNT